MVRPHYAKKLQLPTRASGDAVDEELPPRSIRKWRGRVQGVRGELLSVNGAGIVAGSIPDHGGGEMIGQGEKGEETKVERRGRESQLTRVWLSGLGYLWDRDEDDVDHSVMFAVTAVSRCFRTFLYPSHIWAQYGVFGQYRRLRLVGKTGWVVFFGPDNE